VHFGKLDVERWPTLAKEYEVSLSPTSLDLPTLILFKNGKEIKRLPDKTGGADNEELKKIKSQLLKNTKTTWDRLGWDRSMVSLVLMRFSLFLFLRS